MPTLPQIAMDRHPDVAAGLRRPVSRSKLAKSGTCAKTWPLQISTRPGCAVAEFLWPSVTRMNPAARKRAAEKCWRKPPPGTVLILTAPQPADCRQPLFRAASTFGSNPFLGITWPPCSLPPTAFSPQEAALTAGWRVRSSRRRPGPGDGSAAAGSSGATGSYPNWLNWPRQPAASLLAVAERMSQAKEDIPEIAGCDGLLGAGRGRRPALPGPDHPPRFEKPDPVRISPARTLLILWSRPLGHWRKPGAGSRPTRTRGSHWRPCWSRWRPPCRRR